MKVEGINQHIDDINLILETNPDMQFRVELLKAKSIALLAATQSENRQVITATLKNDGRDRLRIDTV